MFYIIAVLIHHIPFSFFTV